MESVVRCDVCVCVLGLGHTHYWRVSGFSALRRSLMGCLNELTDTWRNCTAGENDAMTDRYTPSFVKLRGKDTSRQIEIKIIVAATQKPASSLTI